jgi:hypothetical protein
MKPLRFILGYIGLVLGLPVAAFFAFKRARRRALNRCELSHLAKRPL